MSDERPRRANVRRARKLLGVTLGLASVSMAGTACVCGNLVAPARDAGPPIDAPREDAPEPPRPDAATDPDTGGSGG